MPTHRRHIRRNIGFAVAVIGIVLIGVVTGLYGGFFNGGLPSPLTNGTSLVGVHVGDVFTYKLTGSSVLGSADAVVPAEFSQYNDTEFYRVTITGVSNSSVSLDTLWRFINGSEVATPQTINLTSGHESNTNAFFGIYSSNLSVKDLLHPGGKDGLAVNSTDTQTFTNSTRTRNYWSIENEFVDKNDPTGNTLRDQFMGAYFDKQTGMLDSLTHIEFYTNPEMELIITWQLTSSTVWSV